MRLFIDKGELSYRYKNLPKNLLNKSQVVQSYRSHHRKLIVIDYDILIECHSYKYTIRNSDTEKKAIDDWMLQLISQLCMEKTNQILVITNKDKTIIDERLLRVEKLNLACENGFIFRRNQGSNWRWKYIYDFPVNWQWKERVLRILERYEYLLPGSICKSLEQTMIFE